MTMPDTFTIIDNRTGKQVEVPIVDGGISSKAIRELEVEENEVSYRRRLLQGRIDILRAELVARLQKSVAAGESELADVDRLTDILSSKAAPHVEEPSE